jgi:DNA-binding PadR family transcriptional regulator
MSVPSGILAVLTLGPAYGLQIHGELESRMERVGLINVGQIYSTLDRLQNRHLVTIASFTHDGLPQYALTELGHAVATEWLTTAPKGGGSWDQMVSQVLVALSMPDIEPTQLLSSYRSELSRGAVSNRDFSPRPGREPDAAGSAGQPGALTGRARLGARARELRATAALEWIRSAAELTSAGEQLVLTRDDLRPRRGRKPRAVPTSK